VTVPPAISVVIPTLNEAGTLPDLLDELAPLSENGEIIVSDGGSSDGTREIARTRGALVISGPPGRGAQLRAGAVAARNFWLFFLHADTRVTITAAEALIRFVEGADPDEFAHFRLRFDREEARYRVIEFGQRLRERLFKMPYGDQGLILSRALYDQVGGFPDWPIMEDVGIVDRLERQGRRTVLDARLITSSRRYRREGAVRASFRNLGLILAFRMGADPVGLAYRYRPEQPVVTGEVAPKRAVVLFAKAPVPGRVKTRLAADVGDERAARIYRELGRRAVDAVRSGPWETSVHVEPPDDHSIREVARWLGAGIRYAGQSSGDLGERLGTAIDVELRSSDEVCVVGTDIPELDEDTLRKAFEALRTHDVVLGPATDGGYYLVGMSQVRRELFVGIPWSTSRVFGLTLERAERAGLSVSVLEAKTDVDKVGDLPEELRHI